MIKELKITDQRFQKVYNNLKLFPAIDEQAIGRFSGSGSGHVVFDYQDDKTIKIPRNIHHHLPLVEKQKDIATIFEVFPKYATPTTLIGSDYCPGYCAIQERFNDFADITPFNFSEVNNDFAQVIALNNELIAERGLTLDFIGLKGILNCLASNLSDQYIPTITNLVIDHSSPVAELKIMDMNLLRLGDEYHQRNLPGLWHKLTSYASYGLTHSLMERHFADLY